MLVYGTGASLIHEGDILIYADMARWEIQLRYRRKELANWKMDNYEEDQIRKVKRGYFIEWRVADRLKKRLYPKMDYLLDTNVYDKEIFTKINETALFIQYIFFLIPCLPLHFLITIKSQVFK